MHIIIYRFLSIPCSPVQCRKCDIWKDAWILIYDSQFTFNISKHERLWPLTADSLLVLYFPCIIADESPRCGLRLLFYCIRVVINTKTFRIIYINKTISRLFFSPSGQGSFGHGRLFPLLQVSFYRRLSYGININEQIL